MDFIKSIFSKKEIKPTSQELSFEELRAAQKELREEFFSVTDRTEKEKADFHEKDSDLCVLINQAKK